MYEEMISPKAQRERCDRVADRVAEYVKAAFPKTEEGLAEFQKMPFREQLYTVLVLIRQGSGESVKWANWLLTGVKTNPCHFAPMIALQILGKYKNRLGSASFACLTGYVKEHIEEFRAESLDYLGVNDNFPSMATYTLVMGGQLLHRPELTAQGKERLMQFRQLLTRRGVASEYNSPTYSSIQLLAMAELAGGAEDEEVRRTALLCESRIWRDLLAHLHRETAQIAGPYSRAYADDSAGYTGLVRSSLYALFGEELPVHLFNTLLETEEGGAEGYSHNGALFGQINTVWLTDTVYMCPQELVSLALEKSYPYEMWATTEFTSSTDAPAVEPLVRPEGELANYEYPAGTGRIYTYMTADYAMGTATHEFHNGVQTDSFHILYRRKVPVLRQRDVGTVYARYLTGEETPVPDMVLLEDHGRKTAVQKGGTAMVLYKPKPFFGQETDCMRLTLVLPGPGGKKPSPEGNRAGSAPRTRGAGSLPEENFQLWLGERKMEGDFIASKEPCSVYIADGPVYMAFHPLLLTDWGRETAVIARWENGFLTVSFYNYEGPRRKFAMGELLLTGNGFVAETGTRAEWGSFEHFRAQAEDYEISDGWQSTIHSRFSTLRKTVYRKSGLTLACEYSPVTEGIKALTVNGEPLPEDKFYMTKAEA